jgi:Zn-dependent protease with chaperone function
MRLANVRSFRIMLSVFPETGLLASAVAVILALVPALLRWWWGRALIPLVDDPAFPERLAAHRLRTGRSLGVALGFLIFLATRTLWWSAPLLILSCSIAGYQFRRAIFRETWGLGTYLSFFTRAIVANFGFWLLLAGMPALARLAAPHDLAAAIAFAALLLAWNARHSDSIRRLLRTRPVENTALLARFLALAQASDAKLPRFEQIDLHGGSIANAFALPSLRQSSVLFTDSLLSRLEADESVAICGHEIAHLEHFNDQRLRTLNRATLALIAGSVVTVAIARLDFVSSFLVVAAWPCAVTGVLAWRVRDRQQHETDSDLRAVALTGNAEALASALTKIHAFAHIPRRVDLQREQQCTHPSLARRIKAIRAANTIERPALTEAATFSAAATGTDVTFGAERLEWREGDAAIHSLSYSHLAEVRLDARPSGPMHLLVVEVGGRRWSMPMKDEDVARAQGVLDLVDGRLPDLAKPSMVWPAAGRVLVLIAASLTVMAGQVATGLIALMAMVRPTGPLAAAAGASAIVAAALARREGFLSTLELQPWISVGLATTGAVLLWTAWTSRKDSIAPVVTRLVTAVGVLATLALIAALSPGTNLLRLHQASRSLTAGVVWPIAFGVALACYPGRYRRWAAIVPVLAGFAVMGAGSTAFLDRFASDPFLLPSEHIALTTVTGPSDREFNLPFYSTDVRISPNARHVAARALHVDEYDRQGARASFHVGPVGSSLSPLEADDVAFVDDDHVLVLDERDDRVKIVELALGDPPTARWELTVPDVRGARLAVRSAAREWRLLGWDRARRIVRVTGRIGGSDTEITRWVSPVERGIGPVAVAVSGNVALVVDTRFEASLLEGMSLLSAATLLNSGLTSSHVWRVGQNGHDDLGTSYLSTHCFADALGDERLVCSGFDGTRTRLVALDPSTGGITAIGSLDGMFASYERAPAGWLTGWLDTKPVAIRLATREVISLGEGEGMLVGVAAADRWFGALTTDGGATKVRLFSLR